LLKVATADLDGTVSGFTFSVRRLSRDSQITAFRDVDTIYYRIEVTGAAMKFLVILRVQVVPGDYSPN
jgi:hypothetical protein